MEGHQDASSERLHSLQATKLARAMVTKYGMSTSLGPTSYEDNGRSSLSSETRAAVESEVRHIPSCCGTFLLPGL